MKTICVVHDGADGRRGQLGRLQEPLLGDVRLDHRLAALAMADIVGVFLFLFDQSQGAQVVQHFLPAGEAVQADDIFPGWGRSCAPARR